MCNCIILSYVSFKFSNQPSHCNHENKSTIQEDLKTIKFCFVPLRIHKSMYNRVLMSIHVVSVFKIIHYTMS